MSEQGPAARRRGADAGQRSRLVDEQGLRQRGAARRPRRDFCATCFRSSATTRHPRPPTSPQAGRATRSTSRSSSDGSPRVRAGRHVTTLGVRVSSGRCMGRPYARTGHGAGPRTRGTSRTRESGAGAQRASRAARADHDHHGILASLAVMTLRAQSRASAFAGRDRCPAARGRRAARAACASREEEEEDAEEEPARRAPPRPSPRPFPSEAAAAPDAPLLPRQPRARDCCRQPAGDHRPRARRPGTFPAYEPPRPRLDEQDEHGPRRPRGPADPRA